MTMMNAVDVLGVMRGVEDVDDGEANALIAQLNLKGTRRHCIRQNAKPRTRRVSLRPEKDAREKALAMYRRMRARVVVKALSEMKENFCW